MTRQQVDAYKSSAVSYRLDPQVLAEQGTDEAIEWLRAQSPESDSLIYATAEPEAVRAAQEKLGVAQASQIIESALAELAVVAREQGIRRFIVAGGETSGAVTKALDVAQLDIGAEIAPGVPWTYCHSAGQQIALTLKSGNFGAVTFFQDAINRLG